MKKVIPFLLGLVIGFAICYFTKGTTESAETTETARVSPPKGLITEAEGIELNNAYTPRHRLISDSILRRDDNRSSWWPLQDVRDYLDYAENQSRQLGYTMSGVRIYLGAYPDTQEGPGYTTVFMVPIGTKGTSEAAMLNLRFFGDGDIPGGDGLNAGGNGQPPGGNYPNN